MSLTIFHCAINIPFFRMSVKRISQQAKEELAKQSAAEETSLRRASIADAVSVIDIDCCIDCAVMFDRQLVHDHKCKELICKRSDPCA